MLTFMNTHIGTAVMLDDIAASANVCPREAQRIFGRYLRERPLACMQRLRICHAAALNDTLGVSFCLVGLAISAPDGFTALKILLVVVFLWLASPVASHLLCRLEVETNEERGQYMNVHEQSLAQEREEAARAKEEQA